jgi:nitroreductase
MQNLDIIKQPALDYPIHPLIASRWSPRAYKSKPVEPEKLQRIFEAARWTASSSNQQPWHFLVGIKGDEVYEKIFATLVEFNQLWVINAPVLVLAIAKITNPKGQPNNSYAYDLGQSVAMLSLQAMTEGVYTHQMGGFDSDAASKSLEIPDEYKALVAFTLGYRGDAGILHPNLLNLEQSSRVRRNSGEFVFTGSFGHKAEFL